MICTPQPALPSTTPRCAILYGALHNVFVCPRDFPTICGAVPSPWMFASFTPSVFQTKAMTKMSLKFLLSPDPVPVLPRDARLGFRSALPPCFGSKDGVRLLIEADGLAQQASSGSQTECFVPEDSGSSESYSSHPRDARIVKPARGRGRSPKLNGQSSDDRPHRCSYEACKRSFYKLEQLKRHHDLVHLNIRPWACESCALHFGTKQNMQVHLTTRKHLHRAKVLAKQQLFAASVSQ